MALVDRIEIRGRAGRGGNGVVRWLHLKGKEKGGPSGGDGGRGGDLIFRAVRDLGILARYRGRADFFAGDGEAGGSDLCHGAAGEDLVVEVPIGSSITRHENGATFELLSEGETVVALAGGRGGFGNAHFKSSTNQNPYEQRDGERGEEDVFTVELKIIADAGFIGLPNAGKSSLLNALTSARAKIGDYPFTTLEPNLGVHYGFVLADIPGLIEGAAEGKGLGHRFLRHIERTKLLVHCISAELVAPIDAYRTIRAELAAYDPRLAEKPELIFITKSDMVSAEGIAAHLKAFEDEGLQATAISVLDDSLIKLAGDTIVHRVQAVG